MDPLPDIRDVEAAFDSGHKIWRRRLAAIAQKLRRNLDRAEVRYSIRYRVKSLESFLEKRSRSSYAAGSKIKDLLGLRIAVPFLEDIEVVVDAIGRSFEVLEIERKAEQLSAREFAYDSVHIIAAIEKVEAGPFPPGSLPAICEIQVRTILQDAWAEIEHELVYKRDFDVPDESMKKKLAALNASLALSDMIFQEVRDRQNELRRWGSERFRELEKKLTSTRAYDLPRKPVDEEWASRSNAEDEAMDASIRAATRAHNARDYPAAIRHYTSALEGRPRLALRSRLYNHRGMARFSLGDERAALDDFEQSVKADSTHCSALNNCALVWRRFGYIQKSLEYFSRSLALESRQADVRFMRAQTFFEIGELSVALDEATAALELEPWYPEATRLRLKVERALAEAT